MNNAYFFSALTFVALFLGALFYTETLQQPFLHTAHFFKAKYHDLSDTLIFWTQEHLRQAETIKSQRARLQQYEKSHLLALEFANELDALLQENNSSIKSLPHVTLVRALSYAKFGDHFKLWLDFKEFNSSKVYGLSYQGYAAGIVVAKNQAPLALLNNDRKSAYSVFVGKEQAPGIIHGNGIDRLVVEYIPTWKEVHVGDEVVTSGLDTLFFKGLKVGVVEAIEQSQGYQNAIVKPYFMATDAYYFHVIESTH